MISGGWVCALHVRTAGLAGAALGSDEEEIVYLAYVVIDVLTNQILGEREYAVRPTRRPAAELPTGQPLQVVVQQFDEWVRSLQVDPHSPLFRLVTDGQPPLRQCLHPEACGKDIMLPTYYARFHDLRKEFVRAYTLRAVTPRAAAAAPAHAPPPPPDHPATLHDMLDYLGMSPYVGDGLYATEVKDMASIVQRILEDGFRLELPETIDLVLETGICSKDDEIDGNCIVRARGLPWQSSDQDIAKFFRGLNVAKGGVALCLSPQGRRNGEALVRFASPEHRDMALKRHKHHIGPRYIEVYRAGGDDFLAVAGGATCEAAAFLSRGAQVIVRMRGLPYDATPQQVLDFFSGGDEPASVVDGADGVLFVRRADGRATGDAFVLFAHEADAPRALARHRRLIGARYIELFRSTIAEVQQVLNRSLERSGAAGDAATARDHVGHGQGLCAAARAAVRGQGGAHPHVPGRVRQEHRGAGRAHGLQRAGPPQRRGVHSDGLRDQRLPVRAAEAPPLHDLREEAALHRGVPVQRRRHEPGADGRRGGAGRGGGAQGAVAGYVSPAAAGALHRAAQPAGAPAREPAAVAALALSPARARALALALPPRPARAAARARGARAARQAYVRARLHRGGGAAGQAALPGGGAAAAAHAGVLVRVARVHELGPRLLVRHAGGAAAAAGLRARVLALPRAAARLPHLPLLPGSVDAGGRSGAASACPRGAARTDVVSQSKMTRSTVLYLGCYFTPILSNVTINQGIIIKI